MQHWSDVEQFLIAEAAADLEAGDPVRPCLVAFDGDEPLFTAFLRDFPKGDYDAPVIELLALAGPLGANRLALSIAGRAWSLEDPLPPVVDGLGDLRQRVVCVTLVDGTGAGVDVTSSLHPYDLTEGGVTWGAVARESRPQGWLTSALALVAERGAELSASVRDLRRQARRCVALGHLLGLSEVAARRMKLQPARLR